MTITIETQPDEGEKGLHILETLDCPAWCTAEHADDEQWRVHVAAPRALKLTQAGTADRLVVELAADAAEAHAGVWLWRTSENSGFCLTVAEARQLAAALLAVCGEADCGGN